MPGWLEPNPGLEKPWWLDPWWFNPGFVDPWWLNPGLVKLWWLNPGLIKPWWFNPWFDEPWWFNPGLVNPVELGGLGRLARTVWKGGPLGSSSSSITSGELQNRKK